MASKRKKVKDIFDIKDINSVDQLWMCYVNVAKMLIARGSTEKSIVDVTKTELIDFKNTINQNNNAVPTITCNNDKRGCTTFVTIYPLDTVQKDAILSHINGLITQEIPENYYHNVIFVATEKSLPKLKKILSDNPFVKSENKKIKYESFQIDTFFENIIDNILCPKMRELSKQEIDALVASDPTLNVEELPILLSSDAMAMFYSFPLNAVIEVQRNDEVFATGMTAYRIVKSFRQISMRL
jgi:hypothetical protein